MQINNSMQLGRHAETLRLASITKNVMAQVPRKKKKIALCLKNICTCIILQKLPIVLPYVVLELLNLL